MHISLNWFHTWRRRRFAQQLIEGFAACRMPGWTWHEAGNTLRYSPTVQLGLQEMYDEYFAAPRAQREELLQKYLRAGMRVGRRAPRLWTMAAANIYPMLRCSQLIALMQMEQRRSGEDAAQASVRWGLIGDLCVALAYDFGDHMSYVSVELSEAWGIAPEMLFQTSVDNLSRLPPATWQAEADGVYRLVSQDNHVASQLLVPRTLESLPAMQAPVFIASNRSVVLAADSAREASLLALIASAERARLEQPEPLSYALCRSLGDTWQEISADDASLSAAVRQRLVNFQRLGLGGIYNSQKQFLEAHQTMAGSALVASVEMLQPKHAPEQRLTWSVWSHAGPTLLPHTDLVALHRNGDGSPDDMLMVRWEDLDPLLKEFGTEVPLLPPRVLVRGFPSKAQWKKLLAVRWI